MQCGPKLFPTAYGDMYKLSGAISIYATSYEEKTAIARALREIALEFKRSPLPSRDKVLVWTVVSLAGASNISDAHSNGAVGAKLFWRADGRELPKEMRKNIPTEGMLPQYWDTMLANLLWPEEAANGPS